MHKQTLQDKKKLCENMCVEDLPELSQRCSLSSSQLKQYHRDGHIVVSQPLLPADVAAYRPFLVEVANRELAELSDYERAVGTSNSKFVYSLRTVHPAVWKFITSKAIAKIAAELLEIDCVRLLHYNCFFKPSQGLETPWHQDYLSVPLNTDKVIAAWIPLVELSSDMGTLTFASGSHKLDFSKLTDPYKFSTESIQHVIKDKSLRLTSVGSMAVGDISFHNSLTLHSAPKNLSKKMREVIIIGYYADGACIGVPEDLGLSSSHVYQNPYCKHFLNKYFSGLRLGDLACSATNPIVYEGSNDS